MTLTDPSPSPHAAVARREHELLLCCARTRMDAGRASRIRVLVREGVEWAYLLRTALPHGMMPLLYWHLQAVCPETVPKVVLAHLRDYFHRTVQTNLLLTGELLHILELLEGHGIPAIPYKGPALAASVYGSLCLRQFRDLDVLVPAEDVPKAGDLLLQRGYRAPVHLGGPRETAVISSQCEMLFEGAGGTLLVELHWGITPRYFSFPLDSERLWGRLRTECLAGRAVPGLHPEDLLLILCVHGCKHLWERLEWICDLAELLRAHPTVNWEHISETAAGLGGERMLSLGLLLASDLLGAVVPEDVLRRAQADDAARSLAARVHRRLFRAGDQPPGVVERCLFHVAARERLRDRGRYCVRIAMTPTPGDWALVALPPRLRVVYRLLRPFRLLRKYGVRPLAARLRGRDDDGRDLPRPPDLTAPAPGATSPTAASS